MLRNCSCSVWVLSCSTLHLLVCFLPSSYFLGPLLTSVCLVLLANEQWLLHPIHIPKFGPKSGLWWMLGFPSISVRVKPATADGMTVLPSVQYLLKYFQKWKKWTLHVNLYNHVMVSTPFHVLSCPLFKSIVFYSKSKSILPQSSPAHMFVRLFFLPIWFSSKGATFCPAADVHFNQTYFL